jgi:splicing factor U2AF 65 kDa subunit
MQQQQLQMQQQQNLAMQHPQPHLQQIMAQQLMAVQQQQQGANPNLPTGGIPDTAAITLDRKQREIYVGNLAIGLVDKKVLEELFNQALAHLVPDPVNAPPVYNINFDSQGRFGFVEFRTRELANHALKMDRLIEVHGRHLHMNRPKGYLEPTSPPLNLPELSLTPTTTGGTTTGAGGAAAGSAFGGGVHGGVPSRVLLLLNCLPIGQLRDAQSRDYLREDVLEEAKLHGSIDGVVVPPPPRDMQDRAPGRVYIKFANVEDAVKGRKIFHTRTLDDNAIKAVHVSEEEFEAAADGGWPSRQPPAAGVELPGLYAITPLVSGVSGLTVLNSSLPAMAQANPSIVAAVTNAINEDEIPFEEGYVKLRGFPSGVTKAHIVEFFRGCGDLSEGDVTTVMSADGTPLGEAFVKIHGPAAKLRLALARDRAALPPMNTPAEVLTAFEEDMQRRRLAGCLLA